jgi:hypothetical protein
MTTIQVWRPSMYFALYIIIIDDGWEDRITVQTGTIVSLPDRSASNNLSLRGAMAVAPALKQVTEAIRVVAAFIYAYIIALVVVYQSNAYPFIIAA